MAELNRSPAGRQFLIWGGVATLLLIGLVVAIRTEQYEFDLEAFDQVDAVFESDTLGSAMQQLFVPFVGIFLLSTTPLFQAAVTGRALSRRESIRLALLLLGILTLNLYATVWQNDEFFLGVTDGLLLVMVSGLLLGRAVGFLTGLFVMGFYVVNAIVLEQPSLDEELIDTIFFAIIDLEVVATVWAGAVIGLWRDAWGQLSFLPYRLFVLGFLIEWLSAWLALVGYGELVLLDQLPSALISGISLLVLGLLTQQIMGREAENRLAVAEQAQSQAELKALRAQINPHFLFNALSTIKYHARTQPETAYELLDDLSDVFHTALRAEPFVTLEEELDTVKAYLAIEQARLRQRLTVCIEIDAGVDMTLKVPALVLQPLVENSVVHGIAPKAEGGTLKVNVTRFDSGCQISIIDDGLGFDPLSYQPKGSGIGLTNSRERLVALYGPEFAPTVKSSSNQGTSIIIRIPGTGL
ncbi:MAG: histidine kinase [Chloroflexota bacterium]